jgi:putative ABC transport system substrate-binding protein
MSQGRPAVSATRIEALRAGLRDLGYVEGANIVFEFRWTEKAEELPGLAAELVRMKVDVIYAPSSTEVGAALQATTTVPIVFPTHADPVGARHVASLAHPGGNATGLTVVQTDLTAKSLEILREAVPEAKRFGALSNPTAPSHGPTMKAAEIAAATLGVGLHVILVRTVEEFEPAFSALVGAGVQAVFVPATSLTVRSRPELLGELAIRHRMPSMFGARENVVAGGLMSLAPDPRVLNRRAAAYVDKIFKGAKPADLPVEQASVYELILNQSAAKALGMTLPASVLARADEIIE